MSESLDDPHGGTPDPSRAADGANRGGDDESPTIQRPAPGDETQTLPLSTPRARDARPPMPHSAGPGSVGPPLVEPKANDPSPAVDAPRLANGSAADGPPGGSASLSNPPQAMAELHTLWGESLETIQREDQTLRQSRGGGASREGNWASRIALREATVAEDDAPPCSTHQYRILGKLGEGGMGVIYRARQACMDREIALKMIKGKAAENQDARAKFLSEAVATADLDHPNIVPVHDLGQDGDNRLFYAMKKVQGREWKEAIGGLSRTENLRILLDVCDAIAFAHSKGILHRDLKPENVMIGEYGEVLVMDWGLAISLDPSGKAERLDESTAIGGTPAYMAPEMAAGRVEGIGPHSDIYLLGAILFEILTGKPPHTGDSLLHCLHNATSNVIRPTEVTGELMTIACKAMATDSAERYASVRDLQGAIRAYQSHNESIALADRAAGLLATARAAGRYEDFAQARFAFREALTLWSENRRAADGVAEATLAYAQAAHDRGDYELALSILDEGDPTHAPLRAATREAQRLRDLRQRRALLFQRATAALGVAIVLILTVAVLWIRHETAQRERELTARLRAERRARVLDLAATFSMQLEDPDWSPARMKQLEATIQRVREVDPVRAGAMESSLEGALAEAIQGGIQSPSLQEADLKRLEGWIDLMATRDEAKAADMRASMIRRARRWERIFALAPPFANRSEWLLAPGAVEGDLLRSSPSAPGGGLVSKAAYAGDLRLRVTVPSLPIGSGVRLTLAAPSDLDAAPPSTGGSHHASPGRDASGYRASVRRLHGPDDLEGHPTKRVRIRITRNGALLREEFLAAPTDETNLPVALARCGGRLEVTVGNLPPVVVHDAFPLPVQAPGRFTACVENLPGFVSLRADRRALPPVASPLERADLLYAAGRFAPALALYEDQALTLAEGAIQAEALYKVGLCQLALKRSEAAKSTWTDVARAEGEPWPVLARCQLWLLLLRAGEMEAADAAFADLAANYRFETLVALMPEEVRRGVIQAFRASAFGGNLFFFPARRERVRNLERALLVIPLVEPNNRDLLEDARFALFRAYRSVGEEDRALTLAREALDAPRTPRFWVELVEESSWILRLQGRQDEALRLLEARRTQGNPWGRGLLVERARVLLSLGRQEEALAAVREYLAPFQQEGEPPKPVEPGEYRWYTAARLLEGMLLWRRGQRKGAEAAWRAGVFRPDSPAEKGHPAKPRGKATYIPHARSGMAIMHLGMLASLSDSLDDRLFDQMLGKFMGGLAKTRNASQLAGVMQIARRDPQLRQLAKTIWRSPRGREAAARIAFQSVDYPTYLRLPAITAAAGLTENGLGRPLVGAEDEVLAALLQSGYEAHGKRSISPATLLQLAAAWKGHTGLFGWDGAAASLPPALRGPSAYFIALRLRRKGKQAEAIRLMHAAQADAPVDSPLKRLAGEELKAWIKPAKEKPVHPQNATPPNSDTPAIAEPAGPSEPGGPTEPTESGKPAAPAGSDAPPAKAMP